MGRLRRLGAMGDALAVEEGAEQVGGTPRVARRVGGVDAGEALQEVELAVALRVEPVQQLVRSGHGRANAGAGASWTTTPFLTTARHGAPPIA